jgi:hypothetical protein
MAEFAYREHRKLSRDYYWILIGSLWPVGYGIYLTMTRSFDPLGFVLGWGFVVLILGFVHGMSFSRYGPEPAHISVDEQGVRVRKHLLPAEQIGKVWEISTGKGARVHFSSSIDGNHLLRGVCSYSYFAGARTAVYVEQTRPDAKPRPWLIGTDNPHQLATTIRHLRAHTGGPTHHPDDQPSPDEPAEHQTSSGRPARTRRPNDVCTGSQP